MTFDFAVTKSYSEQRTVDYTEIGTYTNKDKGMSLPGVTVTSMAITRSANYERYLTLLFSSQLIQRERKVVLGSVFRRRFGG